ncbi:MAG: hypothetical protein E6J90_47515 [Deltaproteobacteria bacterium]|nr:MAG: hypothetical protein E6J90_47515 [Deltaproteobacteria bacterium]
MTQTRLRADRRRRARAWSLLGWFLIFVGIGVGGGARDIVHDHFGYIGIVVAGVLGALTSMGGARCVIHAKRLRAPGAVDALAHDPRPPVVYFRPFAADVEGSQPLGSTSWQTNEEQLSAAMNVIGPLVAIGVPQEPLPVLGAARLYVDDSRWQATAHELMACAAIVLLRIGRSPGFWWEFTTAVRCLAPHKLVLLIPRDEALYEEFRAASRRFLPVALAPLTAWHKKKATRGDLKAVIFFDAAWSPSVVDVQTLRVPLLRGRPNMPLVSVLQFAFGPVCENAGLPWKRPGINPRMVALIAILVLPFAALAVVLWSSRSILVLTMMMFGYRSLAARSVPVSPW